MIAMYFNVRNIFRYKIFIAFSAVLGIVLVSLIKKWAAEPSPQLLTTEHEKREHSSKAFETLEKVWEGEYIQRLKRVRDICQREDAIPPRKSLAKVGEEVYCRTVNCPVLVDDDRALFFCFIPKVAGTEVMKFLLNISHFPVEDLTNRPLVHLEANKHLKRVSPSYYPPEDLKRFYKIMFVRHPFERLVSAFRDKAEGRQDQVSKYYERYWKPIMKQLRPDGAPLDKITFPEFIWHVTHTEVKDLDQHWAPYWSRCDPCLVNYDFIGKLETANHDYPYAFHQIGLDSAKDWFESSQTTTQSVAHEYFLRLSEEAIIGLYKIFKRDFDMFGYSLEGFLVQNRTND